MPSSEFVRKLITLKEDSTDSYSTRTHKTDRGTAKLQDTLKKNLTDLNNLARFFDELPKNLLDVKTITKFERYFLSLFKETTFPKAKAGLLHDRIILQACQDLLTPEGSLDKNLIAKMNLSNTVKTNGEYKCKSVLMSAYIGYFVGLLSSKIGPVEQNKMDSGQIKEIDGPVPRGYLINHELNQHRDERIADLVEKSRFAHALTEMSSHLYKNTQVPMIRYCKRIKNHVLNEILSPSLVIKTQAQQFWVDIMYICKELGDYNTFFAIHNALKSSGLKALPDATLFLKYSLCAKFADPTDDYKAISADAKQRMDGGLGVIPFCLHTPKDMLFAQIYDDQSKGWQATVDTLFSKNHYHHKHITQLTATAYKKIESAQKSLQTLFEVLTTEMPNLHPAKQEPLQKDAHLLKHAFRFFKSTIEQIPFDNAVEYLQYLYTILVRPEAPIESIKNAAIDAERELKEISMPNDKQSPLAKTLTILSKALTEIQTTCMFMYEQGQRNIPGLVQPAEEMKRAVFS